jgi:hypothetical protein
VDEDVSECEGVGGVITPSPLEGEGRGEGEIKCRVC